MNKKFLSILVCAIAGLSFAHAQTNTFPTTGNAGIGTLTPVTSLQVIGNSRFGSNSNYAQFNTSGNLTFNGNSVYKVGGNKYVFQYTDLTNYGLYFNSTDMHYEFRNSLAAPVFYIHADSGQGVFSGGVSVGSLNVPPSKGLYVSGKVGIGTNLPDVKLHVTGGSEVSLTGGGTIVAGLTTSENLAIDRDEIQARNNGAINTLHLNRNGGNVNLLNGSLVVKDANGFVGIGTSEPTVPLNVLGGFALSLAGGGNIVTGATSSYNLGISTGAIQARNNGSGSLLSLNSDGGDVNISRGALFIEAATNNVGVGAIPSAKFHVVIGTDATLSGGGYLVTGATTSNNVVMDNNEIMARNNGNTSPLYLNRDGGDVNIGDGDFIVSGSLGNVGIKSPPLNNHTLQVGSSGDVLGIGNAETLEDFDDFTIGTNSNFVTLTDDMASLGTSLRRWRQLWAIDGSINTSDERDKTNIKDLNYGLKEIMKLRSVRFNWKDKIEKGEKLGLIAQELQKVLPEVVRDYEYKTDEQTGKTEKIPAARLGVMYADIIPVIIRGMQQQQDIIEEQNKKIEALTQLIDNLANNNQTKNSQTESNAKSVAILSDASLEQNAPNPFNQTTVIKYYLPSNAGSAFINVTDMNGKVVKNMPLTAKGKGQLVLQANMLSAGIYNYSLTVNGRPVDTKKMVLTK